MGNKKKTQEEKDKVMEGGNWLPSFLQNPNRKKIKKIIKKRKKRVSKKLKI